MPPLTRLTSSPLSATLGVALLAQWVIWTTFGAALAVPISSPGTVLGCAAVMLALVTAVERRSTAMLASTGMAIGLSAHTLLVAPCFVALLISRRIPLRRWPLAPAVAVATIVARSMLGWPVAPVTIDPFVLSLGAPNIWSVVQIVPLGLPLFGLAVAAAIGGIAAYIAQLSALPLSDRALLPAALLCVLVCAGLLPGMSAHGFFLADVLALALVLHDRTTWRIFVLVQGGSLLALIGNATGFDALPIIGAVGTIVATIRLAHPLLKPAANDNPILARAG